MTPIFGPDELPSPATQITGFTEGLLARIAALEAELEHQTEARKRHAALEREAVLAAGKAIKRAEAAEAEVERLRHQCVHEWVSYRVPLTQPSEFYCGRCGANKKNDVITHPRGGRG